jgi:hypothetical protein
MMAELDGAQGVKLSLVRSEGPAPLVLRLTIDPQEARYDAAGLENALLKGNPAIAVRVEGNAVNVNPVTVREEDDGVIASRLGALLL